MKKQMQAPYQKNETVTLTITGLGSSGEGIGRLPASGEEDRGGYTVFVKDAVIGDRVRASIMKAGKTYAFARLQEIVEPSPDRIAPRCPIARSCGGCQIQMMDYGAQLEYKRNKVREDLIRIGDFSPDLIDEVLYPAVGMDGPGEEPWRYRNKEQVPVGYDREGRIAFGFYAGRTHAIVPMKDCLIGREGNALILDTVREWMEKNHIEPYDEATGKGIVRHVLIRDGRHSGQIMVCIVANADSIPEERELAGALAKIPGVASVSLNTNKDRTNVILGRKVRTLWGKDAIEDSLFVQKVSYPETEGDDTEERKAPFFTGTKESVRFGISPLSFYQVNPRQTEKLYSTVLHFADLTGKEVI
ncbi:MAG: 23S rRNA (uracil(1939)-C(5))-methyltransferase RlmD, partial [Lachnospiraceae bacterium]|nr:23S rRNA (uracil(1939)-C(5))-methyltransferase RlmD [Lachnospiraceae bacterium]